MAAIGADEVAVSNAQFNEVMPEIESERQDNSEDFTLVDSSDLRDLASRIENGNQSEFELILSSPKEKIRKGHSPWRWRSRDVIKSIKKLSKPRAPFTPCTNSPTGQENLQEALGKQIEDQLNDVLPQKEMLQPSKKKTRWNWFSKKTVSLTGLFRHTKAKSSDLHKHTYTDQNQAKTAKLKKFTHRKEKKNVDKLKKINKIQKIAPKNMQNNIDETIVDCSANSFVVAKIKNSRKKTRNKSNSKLKVEAYTQTERNKHNRKLMNAKNQTHINSCAKCKEKLKFEDKHCIHCCDCRCSKCTMVPLISQIHPKFFNLGDSLNTDIPSFMKQKMARQQPFYYMIPQPLPYPPQNFGEGNFQQEYLETRKTVAETTTSSTTNSSFITSHSQITRHEKKIYKERISPFKKKEHSSRRNPHHCWRPKSVSLPLKNTSFSRNTEIQSSTDGIYKIPSPVNFQCNGITRKPENIKRCHKFKPKYQCSSINDNTNSENRLEKQLAEIKEQLESLKKAQKEKVDIAVDCHDLNRNFENLVNFSEETNRCTRRSESHLKNQILIEEINITQDSASNEEETENNVPENNKVSGKNKKVYMNNQEKEEWAYRANILKNNETPREYENPFHNYKNILQNVEVLYKKPPMKNISRGFSSEEQNKGGIIWGQHPGGYRLPKGYKPGVVPITSWGSNNSLGHPFMANGPKRQKKKKQKSRCKKICTIFSGRKQNHLKEQLLQQKLDLLEMKTILTELNETMMNQGGEESSEDYEKDEEEENSQEESNNSEDMGTDDIQFSILRPKALKKTVTFRTPLTD